jgi:hypothetical protein
MDCFASLAMTARYTFAFPRRAAPELVHETFRPLRAWGMPGARCTRSRVCKVVKHTR